ncbi:hypothetical protein [Maribellus luteus]|uniref:hypothetical protein n=1 Tax=Maribellus luteus TaxID=2305463 RepID=UPI0011C358C9|nr:hypothetical protein [Maribellus luteus]
MKKLLFILILLLGLQQAFAQVTPIRAVRIADASSSFITNLSVGTLIYNVGNHMLYQATSEITGTYSIATALAGGKLAVFGDGHSLDADNGSVTDALYIDAEGDVGVGTVSPNTSAILEINSTSKGFLVPRLSTTAIDTPAAGMVVFSTDIDCLCFYNGSGWIDLCTGLDLDLSSTSGN